MVLFKDTKQDLWAKGYTQQEVLDHIETFTRVAKLVTVKKSY